MRVVSALVSATLLCGSVGGLLWFARAQLEPARPPGGFHTSVRFRDASKLAAGSPVVIAGVRVGFVERLSVEGDLARVWLQVSPEIVLPADSWATKRADSLFGDGYVEIVPGGQSDGVAAGATPLLRDGDVIARVAEGATTDQMLRGIDRNLPRIERALATAEAAVGTSRNWLRNDFAAEFAAAIQWLDAGGIRVPLERFAERVDVLAGMTQDAAATLDGADVELRTTLQRLDAALVRGRTAMRDGRLAMVSGLQQTRAQLQAAEPTVAEWARALGAVEASEPSTRAGTLGRMLDDARAHETWVDVTDTTKATVAAANAFTNALSVRADVNLRGGGSRLVATARIAPRPGAFYSIASTVTPHGLLATEVVAQPDGTWQRNAVLSSTFALTAQYGRAWGPWAARVGLFENAAGLGADASLLHGRLQFTLDAFGATFAHTPNVRMSASLALAQWLYVSAGVDDVLTSGRFLRIADGTERVPTRLMEVYTGRDAFLGVGFRFTDADMNAMLTFYGAVLAALL